jgi:UDP:flavonoid glycosyltransferase YjiC (YdhE family)
MHILIVTIGTRGDVQPYLALAHGLLRAGHRVTIATHATFQSFIERHGVAYARLAGDIRSLLDSDAGRHLLAERNPVAAVRQLHALAAPLLRQIMAEIIAVADGADVILASTLAYPNAITASQVHRIPLILAGLQPFTPTVEFPTALLPPVRRQIPGRGLYHRLSHHATYRMLQLTSARLANQIRRDLTGLPPLRYADVFGDLIAQRSPVIYGFSEHLLPRPVDYGSSIHITGFWFLDHEASWQPPPELESFLAAGAPPVYIGFGSMSDRAPEQAAHIALEALRRSGQRGILASGWAGLRATQLPAGVLCIDEAPHDWLFPRVGAVVHHGGAGTAAAAMRAGVPQVVVPFSADQPLWADLIHQRSLGAKPIQRRRLTATTLADAVTYVLHDNTIREQVGRMGVAVRQEDGVTRAATAIAQLDL